MGEGLTVANIPGGRFSSTSVTGPWYPARRIVTTGSTVPPWFTSALVGSTSGYFLPKLFLLRKGFSVVEKPSLEAKVAVGEVGYIFAGTDKNAVSLVQQKKVAAGAFSNDDHASLDENSKAAISILGESEALPRHLVSVRKNLPEPVIKRLKEILLSIHQDDDGQKILRQTDNTTKFDALPGGEESVRRKLVELFRPRGNK